MVRVFRKGTEELAATMSPGLVAGEAHLTGKRGHVDERAESAAAEERELDALQSEIDERRAPRA